MLVGNTTRRVAIIGGARIPFVRSMGAYAECSNQQMLTAALQALADKYRLAGERLGDVGAGAVLKSPRDFNLTREAVLGTTLELIQRPKRRNPPEKIYPPPPLAQT